MREAVIVEAVRTPVGKRKGALGSVRPDDLLASVLKELVNRARMSLSDVCPRLRNRASILRGPPPCLQTSRSMFPRPPSTGSADPASRPSILQHKQ